MAESKVMLLISLDDPSDLNLRAVDEARGYYAAGRSTILTSSLQEKCLAFARCLRDLWKCTYLPSADWEEVPTSLSDSECSDNSGYFTLIDSSSSLSTHAKRLESIVFAPMPQFLVVVAQPTVVGEVLRLVAADTEGRIVLVSIDSSRRTGKILHCFGDAQAAVAHFVALPLRQSNHSLYAHLDLEFQPAPQPYERSEKPWRTALAIPATTPSSFSPPDISTRLSSLFLSAELRPRETSTSGTSELAEIVKSETEPLVRARLESMEKAVSETAARRRQLREGTEAIGAVLKSISEGLKATAEKLAEVNASLGKAIEESESELATALSDTENGRQTLDSLLAAHEKALPTDLFTVTSISQRPDLTLVALVYPKKEYSIPCFVRVMAEGEEVMMKEVVIDNSKEPVEIGYLDEFTKEVYEVTIVDVTKSRAISNSMQLSVRSFRCSSPSASFEDSILYQSVGNMEEIEHSLRATAGENGVTAMQSLAARWSNAQADKVGEFLELCVKSPADQMEGKLLSAGFLFEASNI